MASTLGTGSRGSLNVEINIVPFIDLMSCLTAFLLVTAVWVNIASLEVSPQGRARGGDLDAGDPVKLSMLVEQSGIWLGVSRVNELEHVDNLPDGNADWARVAALLRAHKATELFVDRRDIEVAASDSRAQPVAFGQLVTAMDSAIGAGFTDVHMTDAQGLSAAPPR